MAANDEPGCLPLGLSVIGRRQTAIVPSAGSTRGGDGGPECRYHALSVPEGRVSESKTWREIFRTDGLAAPKKSAAALPAKGLNVRVAAVGPFPVEVSLTVVVAVAVVAVAYLLLRRWL